MATAKHEVITVAERIRHEDPTFVITGRPKDVAQAKREVLTAAECITHVPAPPETSVVQNGSNQCLGSSVEEQISISVRVPHHAVGFVVGYKGARIKRIQQLTSTRIISPYKETTHIEAMGKREGAERSKPEIDYNVVKGSEGQELEPHRSVSASSYFDVSEDGTSNGAPLDNSPLVATPRSNWRGTLDDMATAKNEVVTASDPIKHEDPIFAITGRPEDVAEAKRKVLTAAECITHIPAPPEINVMQNGSNQCLGSFVDELVTINVPVPRPAVAFVVGRNESRIKTIQQRTSTCREKPYLETKGKREDGERSKPEIDNNVAKGTEVSVTKSHIESEYNSPSLHRCSFSPPSYSGIVEGGFSNGAPLDSPPLDTTPQANWGGTLHDVATAKHEVVTAVGRIRPKDPIFVITGRPEDVAEAKRKVLTAAECITHIPAPQEVNAMQNGSNQCLGSSVSKLITIKVPVPRHAVSFVVGCKGSRIKRIQQLTSTYISSPPREKPYLEAMGKREEAERSKPEIESIVAMDTEGSVTNYSHSDSEYNSPRLHDCRLSDATQLKFKQQLGWEAPQGHNVRASPAHAAPTPAKREQSHHPNDSRVLSVGIPGRTGSV